MQAAAAEEVPEPITSDSVPSSRNRHRKASRPLGLASIGVVKQTVSIPVVAIGGITHANAAEVFSAGADMAAVISAVLSSPDTRGISKADDRDYRKFKTLKPEEKMSHYKKIAGILVFSAFFGASCSRHDDNVIKIGAAGPMTGAESKMGMDLKNAAELAVAEWNAKEESSVKKS